MKLSEEDKEALVDYRFKKAKETFAEIPILIENKLWRNAANRLYYACFYAASALLVKDGYQARTHNGVKTILSLHYIGEDKIGRNLVQAYGKLFNMRQRGVYEDWLTIEEENIKPLLEPAEQFIKTIEILIDDNKNK